MEELAEAERESRLGRVRHGRGGNGLRRWASREPEFVHQFWQGFEAPITFLKSGLRTWSYRLKTTNLAEGFFHHLRRFLGRFPGFVSPDHAQCTLALDLLGADHA